MIRLDARHPRFPELSAAHSNGLLAIGGNLEVETLCAAYQRGIFPWYEEGQPLLWWSPDPRLVLLTNAMRVSRSLGKTIKTRFCDIRLNHNFKAVIEQCAAPRSDQRSTWITPAMKDAYLKMHRAAYAHSLEVYQQGCLVGGLYGVAIGRMFFGESMFATARDASKVALFYLCRHLHAHRLRLIDCQVHSAHLQTLGAFAIRRAQFAAYLAKLCCQPTPPQLWRTQRLAALCTPQRQQTK